MPDTPTNLTDPQGRPGGRPNERGADPGNFSQIPASAPARLSSAEVIAAALSLVWLAGVALFFMVANRTAPVGTDSALAAGLTTVMTMLAIFLPIALIWVAAITARTARGLRAEAFRLQSAIDSLKGAAISASPGPSPRPGLERRIDELAAAQRLTEAALLGLAKSTGAGPALPLAARRPALQAASAHRSISAGPAAAHLAVPDDQPTFALGTPADDLAPPISLADIIRALNFPDSNDDEEGFRALRLALADRTVAKLIRATQDVLTLLSQDGIYMDDLKSERARPEFWRKFAAGERGRAIAPLGGVRDRSSLALAAGRMRQDPVFRDAAHHFLRQFDRSFASFEPAADDADIALIADTRTARAFMLLGRISGTFD